MVAFIGGLLLILAAYIDALWTTLTLRGGGPLTIWWSRAIWSCCRLVSHRWYGAVLPIGGSLCLVGSIALWVLLLWAGWSLLFISDPAAVVEATTGRPAVLAERIYYAGFAVFTLGVGDYAAQGIGWLIATDLAAISGLFLVTLAITYALPVLSAGTEKHQIGAILADLGPTPETLLQRFHRIGYDRLVDVATQVIGPQLHLHGQRHLAYPVIHFFRSPSSGAGLAVHVAIYDQALALLQRSVPDDQRPSDEQLELLRKPVGSLLEVATLGCRRAGSSLPDPDPDELRRSGLRVVDEDVFAESWRAEDERRQQLADFLLSSGWDPSRCW